MIYKFIMTMVEGASPFDMATEFMKSQVELQKNPPTGKTGPHWIKNAEGTTIGHWEVDDKQ